MTVVVAHLKIEKGHGAFFAELPVGTVVLGLVCEDGTLSIAMMGSADAAMGPKDHRRFILTGSRGMIDDDDLAILYLGTATEGANTYHLFESVPLHVIQDAQRRAMETIVPGEVHLDDDGKVKAVVHGPPI